jgi:hypothetical protein
MDALINILVAAIVLLLVWWILSQFMPPKITKVIGVLFGVILLVYALKVLGIFNWGGGQKSLLKTGFIIPMLC